MTLFLTARRTMVLGLLAATLAACVDAKTDFSQAPEPLGDFSLGYNIVVVKEPTIGPLSRTATDAEWQAAMEQAVAERFSRFNGEGTYHIAIKVEAYALAQTGIPLVISPKSVLVISANVWSTTAKINPEPEQMTIFEGVSGETVLGSGLTQTKEQQMAKLAANAAGKVEEWLRMHPEWFNAPPLPENTPEPAN